MLTGLERIAVLAGATASGKTDLAVELSTRMGAEIVSVDSQQVYRGFDVGTAKPSLQQRAQVRHHLISAIDPSERMDAARYARDASLAISQILAQGRPVLVVGGSGLYLRALVFGVVEGPGRDEEFRNELEHRADRMGRAALHAELAILDPESASRIEPQDLVRIIRALEIHRVTGRLASEVRGEHAFARPRYRTWGRWLNPPREELYRRIDRRSRALFEGGLLEETSRLLASGLGAAAPMTSIGYSEARKVLEGVWSQERGVVELAKATRHYAKRQLTWFRKEPWLEPVSDPRADDLERQWREFLAAS